MSNFSNQSVQLTRLWDTIPQVAYAMARGKDGLADSANDMFRLVMTDESVSPEGIAAKFYDEVRSQAVAIGIAKRAPLKDQSAKSKASQISKLENFPTLGNIARDNEHVEPAFEYARELVGSGYTKLVKCAVAMKTCLAKDIHADENTLRAAINKSMEDEPKLASAEVEKLGEAFAKLVHGDKDMPSKHEAMFARLMASYPADYAETCRRAIDTVVTCLKRVEADAAAAVAIAKAPK